MRKVKAKRKTKVKAKKVSKQMEIKLVYRKAMTKMIQMRMEPSLFYKLTKLAEKKKIPRTELIRQILQQVADKSLEEDTAKDKLAA